MAPMQTASVVRLACMASLVASNVAASIGSEGLLTSPRRRLGEAEHVQAESQPRLLFRRHMDLGFVRLFLELSASLVHSGGS